MTVPSSFAISPDVVSRDLGRALMVLDTGSGRYFRLEGAGASIWPLLDTHHDLASLTDAAAAASGRSAAAIRDDVRAFVTTAIEDGLIVSEGTESDGDQPPSLRIERTKLHRHADLQPLRQHFAERHYVRLPSLLEPALLKLVAKRVDEGEFVDRAHHGIGTELCLVPGVATGLLQMLFNDPALLDAVEAIAGCRAGCFDGRVYRMSASGGHHDSWHSDAGEDRLVAVSLNLSPEPYEGGDLEIRPAAASEATDVVRNAEFGSAVMFRISPALRHRVNALRGSRPRTAYAGWFRSTPDFQELFFGSLPNAV